MNSMLPALMQRAPLKNGVAELSPDDSGTAVSGAEQAYLPDFGTSANVLVLLVIAQVVALLLALVRDYPAGGYLQGLGEISILILWLAVSSAWLLAAARPFLISGSALRSSILVLAIVLINTAVSSQAIFWFGSTYGDPQLSGPASMFPQNRELFLARNMAIALVVTLAVLRYFYVIHQWRSNMESVAESRFVALQARIRPHFLFNSMNTIASLTRSDPLAAERAIEDLADLFRLYGAGRIKKLVRLQIPTAVRYLTLGAKTSSGLAVIGAIVAEFFVGNGSNYDGLGTLMTAWQGFLKTDALIAALFASTMLGLLLFASVFPHTWRSKTPHIKRPSKLFSRTTPEKP